MIFLSDCFTEKVDEGCLKVANTIARKSKQMYEQDTILVSYNRKVNFSDIELNLNKLFLNKSLFEILKKEKNQIVYIPFASNTLGSALRVWILSKVVKADLKVIFVLRFPMNKLTTHLLKKSKVEVVALSYESYVYYKEKIGRATYLRTGVNTSKFVPADNATRNRLREKYGIENNKKVLLHVGHLKKGRNIDKLLLANSDYHVVLVVSSVTEKDLELKEAFCKRPNTTIIESYIENIEEVYQLADVYFFPVVEKENCIDVPLSVLEAAACNVPIVATPYGELKSFKENEGFMFIDSFDENYLNSAFDKMSNLTECNNRDAVLDYDWECSIKRLFNK